MTRAQQHLTKAAARTAEQTYVAGLARFHSAVRLERARQRVRENVRYGYPITKPLTDAIHTADLEYDAATYDQGGERS